MDHHSPQRVEQALQRGGLVVALGRVSDQVPAVQHLVDLLLRLGDLVHRSGLHDDLADRVVAADQEGPRGAQRHDGGVVLLPVAGHHADHPEVRPADPHVLADRRGGIPVEQRGDHVRAEHHNPSVALGLGRGEILADHDLPVQDAQVVRGGARQRAEELLLAVGDQLRAVDHRGGTGDVRGVRRVGQRRDVVVPKIFRQPAAWRSHVQLVHDDLVRQCAELGVEAGLDAVAKADQDDDRRDPDHDAQRGQRGP